MVNLCQGLAAGLLSALLASPGPVAAADWNRLETDHFVILSKLTPDKGREFATRLELLH